jgi:RNA polymerase sigma factor (sigma-70 family)
MPGETRRNCIYIGPVRIALSHEGPWGVVRLAGKGTTMDGRKKQRATRPARERPGSTPWVALREKFYPQIRSWFAARVANAQDADDLAEEVLVRLARAAPPDDLNAYITTATANALARYRRRKAQERDFLQRLLQEGMTSDEILGCEPKDLSEEGEPSEIRAEVENILSTLPPGEAQLLRLRFLDGLSVAAVARRAECSEKAAYKRLERILRRLRERYGVEPPAARDGKDPQNP